MEAKVAEQAQAHEKLEALARRQERKIRVYYEKWEEVKRSARDKERVRREAKASQGGSGEAEGGGVEGGEGAEQQA